MLKPPFKLATTPRSMPIGTASPGAIDAADPGTEVGVVDLGELLGELGTDMSSRAVEASPAHGRARLSDMEAHVHCSVIGTCLSTCDLRKLMARFLFVRDSSDLEVHHEAVTHARRGGQVAKALHKLLDQRHEAVVQRFARARDSQVLATLWEEALRQGEIPGAYWAVLTHRAVTLELRQKAFGDVHMLSHLVGAANRADIRHLVALERDNEALRERADGQQRRNQASLDDRDRAIEALERRLAETEQALQASRREEQDQASGANGGRARTYREAAESAAALMALQTQRRESAEHEAALTADEARRLRLELEHLGEHTRTLGRELAAAETQLREVGAEVASRSLDAPLRGRRVLYVGGRPSSTPAIRDLVTRHGGEFQRHDGGLEDRKGLLAAGIGWAHLVVFPVDCVDHDSAGNLKRLCARQGVDYLPLRSASVASFASALASGASGADRLQ